MEHYYGSIEGNMERLERISSGSFKTLVETFFLTPYVLSDCTRDYFLQLPKEKQLPLKIRHYYSAFTFKEHKIARKGCKEKAEGIVLMSLDIEGEGAQEFHYNRTDAIEAIAEYNFVLYTTPNHTSEAPRYRLVIELERLPLTVDYASLVKSVGKTLGLTHITPESLQPSWIMGMPSRFSNETEHDKSARFLYAQTNQRALRLQDFDKDGALRVKTDTALPRTIEEWTPLTMAQQALDFVSADCDYGDWLRICFALHHQYGEEGFELFHSWSQKGGDKYKGEEDCRKKWNSVKRQLGITIRTLFHLAKENGWDTIPWKEWLMATLMEERRFNGVEGKVEGLKRWFSELPKRLLAAPLLTSLDVDMFLAELVANVDSSIITKAQLDKRLKLVANEEKAPKDAKVEGMMKLFVRNQPPWTKGLVYVAQLDQFTYEDKEFYLSPEKFNRFHSQDMTVGAILKHLKACHVPPNSVHGVNELQKNPQKGTATPSKFALDYLECLTVYEEVFEPSAIGKRVIQDNNGLLRLNSYIPQHPKANITEKDKVAGIILKHVRALLPDARQQRLLLSYFAYLVQHPGEKVLWCPLFIGRQRCGKTLLYNMMQAVLGEPYCDILNVNDLKGGFVNWSRKLFVAIPEIRIKGRDKHVIMNELKPLITDPVFRTEEKFQSRKTVRNLTNYFLTSNFHDAVPLEKDKDRFFVLEAAIKSDKQIEELRRSGHYAAFVDAYQTYPGGVRAFFEDYEIFKEFQPKGASPSTEAQRELAQATASKFSIMLKECIQEGSHPLVCEHFIVSSVARRLLEPKLGYSLESNRIGTELKSMGYILAIKDYKKSINGQEERGTVWVPNESIYTTGKEVLCLINQTLSGSAPETPY